MRRWILGLAAAAALANGAPAGAQPRRVHDGLRERVGLDLATRLLRSSDPEERLRGIERVAATHTPEALALLIRATASAPSGGGGDSRLPTDGIARKDPRMLLAAVRGLATWSDQEAARSALFNNVLGAPAQAFDARPAPGPGGAPSADPTDDDAVGAARIALARSQAAIALADSGSSLALEALIAAARRLGPERRPAIDALALRPPSTSAPLGGVALTTPPMVALAAAIGDLRTLDAILGAVRSSDPLLRAAAITALGEAGDSRGLEPAREGASDHEPRVRVASATALIRLGATEAPRAVEALVVDDATSADGLRLAQEVPDEGVTRAAAARAVATADPALRTAALVALGRQPGTSAVRALSALAADPVRGGDAACALGRSPSADAMGAIADLARAPATRRLAARAYFLRRTVRDERDPRLEAAVADLARSRDAADRAVATEIRVAAGELALEDALRDGDPGVRRAAAMGALALGPTRPGAAHDALLARWAVETDAPARIVLAAALGGGDPSGALSDSTLAARMTSGDPDGPLAALALAQRAGESESVEALLASRDASLRAHVARGLAGNTATEATGWLVRAYAWEGNADVRRAILAALAQRDRAGARSTFELAGRLDPDPEARWIARRALARGTVSLAAGARPAVTFAAAPRPAAQAAEPIDRDVAWLQIVPAEGTAALAGETALLVIGAGRSVPVVFDADGYALVPGLPPGEGRLRLAPRLPAYSAGSP